MKKTNLILFLLVLGTCAMAQLPNTDLYMFSLKNNGVSTTVTNPVYISGFNPDGYNNQPYFINPREVYITSNKYDDDFTDFLRLDLMNETYYRVTATDSISEFSPTPNAPRGYFSAVRIERDGVTQSLWLYPEDHSSEGKRVLTDLNNVGYHCWLSDTEVALFLVGDIMSLHIGNIEENYSQSAIENIGRCFRQDADGNLLFVHKISPNRWYLKSYDPDARKASIVAITRPEREDFELLQEGKILMGDGSKLYTIDPATEDEWTEIADLAEYGIANISRMTISRNKLILVDTPVVSN